MLKNSLIVLLLLIMFSACQNENSSKSYSACNDLLYRCTGSVNGQYCTFGYKWGEDNPFTDAGMEEMGPETTGGIIRYAFYDQGAIVNTHSQSDITTLSFNQISVCDPKQQIANALTAWSSMASITFQEVDVPENAHIKFAVANIEQGGVGFPAFTDDLCSLLAGQVVIGVPTRNTCDGFYNLVLHEIGHTLGLGHVRSSNVMNPSLQNLTELQNGDIQGVQSIYGSKETE